MSVSFLGLLLVALAISGANDVEARKIKRATPHDHDDDGKTITKSASFSSSQSASSKTTNQFRFKDVEEPEERKSTKSKSKATWRTSTEVEEQDDMKEEKEEEEKEKKERERAENTATCRVITSAQKQTQVTNAWLEMMKQAFTDACTLSITAALESIDDKAVAFARVALRTYASCTNEGEDTYSWAWGNSQAKAQAQAFYDAWVRAVAEASANHWQEWGCACLADASTFTHAEVATWGSAIAGASAEIKSQVDLRGEGTVVADKTADCFARSTAHVWAQAVAKAWEKNWCVSTTAADHCEAECKREGMYRAACVEACHIESSAQSWAEAKAVVAVDFEVDEEGGCDYTRTKETFGNEMAFARAQAISGDTYNSFKGDEGLQVAHCVATAASHSIAHQISNFAATYALTTLTACGANPAYHVEKQKRSLAMAFAEVYVDVMSRCTVKGKGAIGCAHAASVADAFSTALADAWAEAWAQRDVPEACGCKKTVSAEAFTEAVFAADTLASAFAAAEADLVGEEGSECISDTDATDAEGTTMEKSSKIHCIASATINLFSQAIASGLIDGDCNIGPADCSWAEDVDACEASQLQAQADAEALVSADVSVETGYCTGENDNAWYTFEASGVVRYILGGPEEPGPYYTEEAAEDD